MNKRSSALLLIVPLVFCASAFATWNPATHSWGGAGNDSAADVALDSSGNVYLAGTTNSFGAGGNDVLVLKFDSTGAFQWARTWGGTGDDHAYAIGVGPDGFLYVTGGTNSYGTGWYDAFLLKLDTSGNLIWSKTWGGSSFEQGYDLAFDPTGNIYVAAESYSSGNSAIALKFDTSGTLLSVLSWKGPYTYDAAYSIDVDSAGNILLAGISWDYSVNPNHNRILIIKYDASGNLLWSKNWQGPVEDEAWGPKVIRADANGNIYVLGRTTSFGVGQWDILLLKLDPNGNLIWSSTWGGPGTEGIPLGSLAFEPNGNIELAASSNSFLGGPYGPVLLEYTPGGVLVSSRIFAGIGGDVLGQALALDQSGNAFVAGSATNSSGQWQTASGTTTTPAATIFAPTFTVSSPTEAVSSPSVVLGTPTGILDSGAGGTDAFIARVPPAMSSLGTIVVTSNLVAATFTISGSQSFSGSGPSRTFSNVPAGTYRIDFGAVAGYVTPAPQTRPLAPGGIITFTGNYNLISGTPNVTITLASQNGGIYNYDINMSGCTGQCIDILNGQQTVLSGMAGVTGATALSSSGLNTCLTGSSTGSTATFTETLDPVGCSFGVPATLHAFQVTSTSSTLGTIQYSIQTDVGTFTGTTQGPVAQNTSCRVAVQYWGQCNSAWNPPPTTTPYPYYNYSATTMCHLGCATTSLAMALNSVGISSIQTRAGRLPFDPGSLNEFMKEQPSFNDYDKNENVRFDNTTADVGAISHPGKQFFFNKTAGGWDSTKTPQQAAQALKQAVCGGAATVVMVPTIAKCKVLSSVPGGHFVLVYGEQDKPDGTPQFLIDDPGCSLFTTLDDYNNAYVTIGNVFDPANVSRLDFDVGDGAEISVTDSSGEKTGYDLPTGNDLREIPQSSYERTFLSDLSTGLPATGTTHSIQVFQPISGTYNLSVTGLKVGAYQLTVAAYSPDGSRQPVVSVPGVMGSGSNSTYSVSFSPTMGSSASLVRTANFDSTLADITNCTRLGLINDPGVTKSLLDKIKEAREMSEKERNEAKTRLLRAFRSEIEAQRNQHLLGTSFQILMEDSTSLLSQ